MKLEITGNAKEIAALVIALQERQEEFIPTHGYKLESEATLTKGCCLSNPIDHE